MLVKVVLLSLSSSHLRLPFEGGFERLLLHCGFGCRSVRTFEEFAEGKRECQSGEKGRESESVGIKRSVSMVGEPDSCLLLASRLSILPFSNSTYPRVD